MADSGLGRRIALGILRLAGGRAPAVLLALLGVILVLSFMVPTAAGRISMIVPVCLGIIEAAGLRPPSNFAKAMLVGTSHASNMAGVGLATASGLDCPDLAGLDRRALLLATAGVPTVTRKATVISRIS